VVPKSKLDPKLVLEADKVLVGRNNTRRSYNARLRERRGFEGDMPSAGDKLVCLRNNRKKGLFNGSLWSVKERGGRKSGIMTMRLLPDDETGLRLGAAGMFFRRHRACRLAAAQAL
jgi:exodeoxyribonuclease V